jgi:5-methylcytosine-specific restriction endonuclease McrA
VPTVARVDRTRHPPRRNPADFDQDAVRAAAQPTPRDGDAILQLQRAVGNRAVTRLIQRHCYERYGSYAEAKAANKYSAALLDEQKMDNIKDHERKTFSGDMIQKILAVNKEASGRNVILSDKAPKKELTRQDLAKTPHVDHRFPKSKGGTNSFKNARIISAKENMQKSAKTEDLEAVPNTALDPYTGLSDDGFVIQQYAAFSADQKKALYNANESYYGRLKSDSNQAKLGRIDSSQVPHIDHIIPKSEGGCNYYFNAEVLPADENIQKGGYRSKFGEKGEYDDESGDYATGIMHLKKYYEELPAKEKKHKGGGRLYGESKIKGKRKKKPY